MQSMAESDADCDARVLRAHHLCSWYAATGHHHVIGRRTCEAGQVVINGAAQNLATPFGGWGWSGFGRETGRFGIEDLLNYRSLHGA